MTLRLIRCVLRQPQLGPPLKCIALHDMDLWSLAIAVAFCSLRAKWCMYEYEFLQCCYHCVRVAYHCIGMWWCYLSCFWLQRTVLVQNPVYIFQIHHGWIMMLLQYSCAGVFEFLFHVSISKWMVDLVMNANLRLCLRVALFLLVLFCHEWISIVAIWKQLDDSSYAWCTFSSSASFCYFISVQTSHHRQIPMAHLLNIHIDSCCICKQLHLSTIVFVSAGNCINISAHSPGRAAVTNLHLSW